MRSRPNRGPIATVPVDQIVAGLGARRELTSLMTRE